MNKVKVEMLRTASTGVHYGKKGETVEVPKEIADQWIAIKAAKLSK